MSPEEKPTEDSDSDSHSNPFGVSPNDDSRKATENTDSPVHSVEDATVEDATVVEETVVDLVAPVMAEMAESAGDGGGATINPTHFASIPAASPIVGNLENMSANGGAIGALVLGIWCVIGSFITNWSIINGVIGLLMGFWGLTSRKQRTAWIGIALCVTGIFMSLIQVNELINMYMNAVDETPY